MKSLNFYTDTGSIFPIFNYFSPLHVSFFSLLNNGAQKINDIILNYIAKH